MVLLIMLVIICQPACQCAFRHLLTLHVKAQLHSLDDMDLRNDAAKRQAGVYGFRARCSASHPVALHIPVVLSNLSVPGLPGLEQL